MKKIIAVLMCVMMLSVSACALAVNEDVEGKVGIYTSMYQFMIDIMDEAIKAEFPYLEPAYDGSFFFYGGASSLIQKIYGEMESGVLGCDMLMVAEPSFSLELKEKGYLEAVDVPGIEERMRFNYDPDGTWYPVRVCNMVLAYNPEAEEYWKEKGVTIPHTFKDFAYDTSLKGFISMGNPLTSGTTLAAVASLTDENHFGEAYLDALAANNVMIESGSSAIAKLQTKECAAIMILEESILKALDDAEKTGNPISNLKVIYPEDGVVLIPSNIMTVAEAHSPNANMDACKAVENWLLSDEAQRIILQGYMHSTVNTVTEYPYQSMSTDELIKKDLGVNWEHLYKNRDQINNLWTVKVTTK